MKLRITTAVSISLLTLVGVAFSASAAAGDSSGNSNASKPRPVTVAADWQAELERDERSDEFRRKGDEFQKSGNWNKALEAYQVALSYQPHNADACAGMGEVLAGRGKLDMAIRYYRQATGHEPGQKWASSRMGEGDLQFRLVLLLVKAGQYEEALTVYEEGVSLLADQDKAAAEALQLPFKAKQILTDPQSQTRLHAAAHVGLGVKYLIDGAAGKAESQIRKALTVVPEFAPAYLYLGNCLSAQNRGTDARYMWEMAAASRDEDGGDVRKKARAALKKSS